MIIAIGHNRYNQRQHLVARFFHLKISDKQCPYGKQHDHQKHREGVRQNDCLLYTSDIGFFLVVRYHSAGIGDSIIKRSNAVEVVSVFLFLRKILCLHVYN